METDPSVKKLYRSDTNRYIAGICGGLGEYAHIDPTFVRLSWLIITILSGVLPGIAAYILALFIVPMRKVHTSE